MNNVSNVVPASFPTFIPSTRGHTHENADKHHHISEHIELLSNTPADRKKSVISNKNNHIKIPLQPDTAPRTFACDVTNEQYTQSIYCSPKDGIAKNNPPEGRAKRWILLGGITLITTAVGAFIYNRILLTPTDDPAEINITPSSLIRHRATGQYTLNPHRYNFGLG